MSRFFTFRYWVRKWAFYLIFLILGLFLTGIGLLISDVAVFPPSFTYNPDYQGFGIYSNSTGFENANTDIVLTIIPPTLYFRHAFSVLENGTYNFAFWFPFYVVSPISESENMTLNSTLGGTVITVRHSATTGKGTQETISGWFNIYDTFTSASKGSFVVIIPFGGDYKREAFHEAAKELDISYFSNDRVSLSIDVPYSLEISSEFPPLSGGIGQWSRPSFGNQTVSRLAWNFDRLDETVIVKYEDSFLNQLFESLVFIGGIVLGVGSSITVTVFYDWGKEYWQRQKSRESE